MRKQIIPVSSFMLVIFLMVFIAQGAFAADLSTGGAVNPGTTAPDPNATGSSNLDLQISGNTNTSSGGGEMGGMDKMEGMGKMMGNMGMDGMMAMPNNANNSSMNGMNSGAMNGMNPGVIAQLQASNAMIMQMLGNLSSQPNSNNLQPQIQALYQMLANQTALLQMLYSNSMNASQNNSSGNSGGMGNMGGMM